MPMGKHTEVSPRRSFGVRTRPGPRGNSVISPDSRESRTSQGISRKPERVSQIAEVSNILLQRGKHLEEGKVIRNLNSTMTPRLFLCNFN